MSRLVRARPASRAVALQAPCGSVRSCLPCEGELARHRVLTPEGQDVAVVTVEEPWRKRGFVTGAYPVKHGYLTRLRQPLYETRCADAEAALLEHGRLLAALSEVGVGLVRARRKLAARRRAERIEALRSAPDARSAGARYALHERDASEAWLLTSR